MNTENFGYKICPEDIFSHVCYGNKQINGIQSRNKQKYDDIYRDAGKYIEKYTQSPTTHYPIEHYNFSGFITNSYRHPVTSLGILNYVKEKLKQLIGVGGIPQRVRFVSENINDTLSMPPDTNINSLLKKNKLFCDREIGVLATQVYPDGKYMITLNYQDFPIGYLGYDFNETGEPIIIQIQSGAVVEVPFYHFSTKHHLLDGFDWRKVLVHFFEDLLIEQGYSGNIHIQNAEANEYYGLAKIERIHSSYDTTANEMGYTQKNSGSVFSKSI